MYIGFITFELDIPYANSLKEKRMSIKSIKDRLKRLNVSVAEDGNNLWQRSNLSIACVANNPDVINSTYNEIRKIIESVSEVEIINSSMEFL